MTLPIEYQNLIARRALEVVEPTPGAVDRFRAQSRLSARKNKGLVADIHSSARSCRQCPLTGWPSLKVVVV